MRTAFLALSGLLHRRRECLLVVTVLTLSFSSIVLSLSLLGSMSHTNTEYRLNAYGQWNGALVDGKEEDSEWLSEREWIGEVGEARLFGNIMKLSDDSAWAQNSFGLGSVDEGYRRLGRLRLSEGRWPESSDEIAVEERVLEVLGCEPVCGQVIEVLVGSNRLSGVPEIQLFDRFTFTVCGVIRDYTGLWEITNNAMDRSLISAVVAPSAWDRIQGTLLEQTALVVDYPGEIRIEQIPQYLFTAKEGSLTPTQKNEIGQYLASTRLLGVEDLAPSYNTMSGLEPVSDVYVPTETDSYRVLILAVTLLAVMCVYILQLPRQVHNYAVFRGIGASGRQLVSLIFWEMVLLCVPGALIGTGAGALAVWAVLRAWIYSGSDVRIQVYIPWRDLTIAAFFWISTVLAARAAVFAAAARIPLTGRLRLSGARSRQAGKWRNCLILGLGCAAVTTAVYTVHKGLNLHYGIETFSNIEDYQIFYNTNDLDGAFRSDDLELLRSIPGVEQVDGYNIIPVKVSLDGGEERSVWLTAVEEEYCTFLPFADEADESAFHSGNFVFMVDSEQEEQEEQEAVLSVYETYETADNMAGGHLTNTLLYCTPCAVRHLTVNMRSSSRGVGIADGDLICSHAFLERLLGSIEPGKRVGDFMTGMAYGIKNLNLEFTDQAEDLSAPDYVAQWVKERNSFINDFAMSYHEVVRGYQRRLIMTYAAGGCVLLMVWLLLTSVLSLETRQETQRYTLLRILGMNRRSLQKSVAGAALTRSFWSALGGWTVFLIYDVIWTFRTDPGGKFAELSEYGWLRYVWHDVKLTFAFLGSARCAVLTAGCIAALLVTILLSKQKLLKGGMNNVGDIAGEGIM